MQLRDSSSLQRKRRSCMLMILHGVDLAAAEAFIADRASPRCDCKRCPKNLTTLKELQTKAVRDGKTQQELHVEHVLLAAKNGRDAQSKDQAKIGELYPDNAAAAEQLRAQCKDRANAILLNAVCAALENEAHLRRGCSSEEVQALAGLLTCQCGAWSPEKALAFTRQDGQKLAELGRVLDLAIDPMVAYWEALRTNNEPLLVACRKTLLPLFFVTQHPVYARVTTIDLLVQLFCLSEEARKFMSQMQRMNQAGLDDKWQAGDEILEQFVGSVKKGTHSADSAAAWDASNEAMVRSRVLARRFAATFHVAYMRQTGKQQALRGMEADILNVAAAVRSHIASNGPACTLGGVPLETTSAELLEEAGSRLAAFHRQVHARGTAVFSGQAPVALAKRLQIVDRVEVVKQYKPGRGAEDEFEPEDDEPIAPVICSVVSVASPVVFLGGRAAGDRC